MEKKNWLAASIVALGIVIGGFLIKSGIQNFRMSGRTVIVKGFSEREVKADQAEWPLAYRLVGNDLNEINTTMAAKNKIIKEFLMANGIKENQIYEMAPEIVDMSTERYISQPIRFKFNATCTIKVASDQVDKVRELATRQSELNKAGIALLSDPYQYKPTYTFSKLNEIKPDMIEEATNNARGAAEKFAEDSQSTLGKIKSATQGQFSIVDKADYASHLKTVRVVTSVEYYLKD